MSDGLAIVLIGASGDLARKKILPSIVSLLEKKVLPDETVLLGVGRSERSDEEFRELVDVTCRLVSKECWGRYRSRVFYVAGDVSWSESYLRIVNRLKELDESGYDCSNQLWHVSTFPGLYKRVIEGLGRVLSEDKMGGWVRVMFEKPFGENLANAQDLNRVAGEYLGEERIFRVDHYLAKETVQNVLAFRFGNALFEPVWNREHVEQVQVAVAERTGIESRGEFYDKTGALRDVVQNHVLQMLAVVMMERPVSFESERVREKRMQLLSELRRFGEGEVEANVVRGQYGVGMVGGDEVVAYCDEEKVQDGSETETFVAFKTGVDNRRWSGVPVYVRAGKRLAASVAEISIEFKQLSGGVFEKLGVEKVPNVLHLRVQPSEGIVLSLVVKKPGLEMSLERVPMQFCYGSEFTEGMTEPYERLIRDVYVGERALFPRAEGVKAQWEFVEPVLTGWKRGEGVLHKYEAGSWGPSEADELLARDGRKWHEPSPSFCQLPGQ